jgi:exodeoxyribonuclease VII small subunit
MPASRTGAFALAWKACKPMSEKPPKSFEEKLARIDAIVNQLQSGSPNLEESIGLFKEGKALARECDALLKSMQEQVDEAMAEPQTRNGDRSASTGRPEDEIPF